MVAVLRCNSSHSSYNIRHNEIKIRLLSRIENRNITSHLNSVKKVTLFYLFHHNSCRQYHNSFYGHATGKRCDQSQAGPYRSKCLQVICFLRYSDLSSLRSPPSESASMPRLCPPQQAPLHLFLYFSMAPLKAP